MTNTSAYNLSGFGCVCQHQTLGADQTPVVYYGSLINTQRFKTVNPAQTYYTPSESGHKGSFLKAGSTVGRFTEGKKVDGVVWLHSDQSGWIKYDPAGYIPSDVQNPTGSGSIFDYAPGSNLAPIVSDAADKAGDAASSFFTTIKWVAIGAALIAVAITVNNVTKNSKPITS